MKESARRCFEAFVDLDFVIGWMIGTSFDDTGREIDEFYRCDTLHGIDGNPINGVLLRRRGELKRSTETFYWIDGRIVRFFSPIVLNHRECSA